PLCSAIRSDASTGAGVALVDHILALHQPGRDAAVATTGGSPSAMMQERPLDPTPVTIRRMGGSSAGILFPSPNFCFALTQTTSASAPALGSPMAPVAANVVTLAPSTSRTGKAASALMIGY